MDVEAALEACGGDVAAAAKMLAQAWGCAEKAAPEPQAATSAPPGDDAEEEAVLEDAENEEVEDTMAAEAADNASEGAKRTLPQPRGSIARLIGVSAANARSDLPDLQGFKLPRVAVFDLDETCWKHYGLDLAQPQFRPPFRWCSETRQVLDTAGRHVKIFPELPQVLLALHQAGVTIAVASHDGKPRWCCEVMDCLVLDEDTGLTWGSLVPEELRIIKCSGEFWPGKTAHIRHIVENLPGGPCEFDEVLMFDDSKSVCSSVGKVLGVVAVRCVGGVSIARLKEGLKWMTSPIASNGAGRAAKRCRTS